MIDVAELRELVGLGADTSKDAQLEYLELAAVAFLERQTGRYFGVEEEGTVYVTGTGSSKLWLPYALGETPTVTERPADSADAPADITDFIARGEYLLRTGAGSTWDRDYEYAVTGLRGYTAGEEPEDIRNAVRDLVQIAYDTAGGAMQTETFSGYSYTRADLEQMATLGRTLQSWRGWPIA